MENNQEQEKVFYQDPSITVTQARYIANGKMYAMRNISSVSLFTVKASYALQILLLIIGVIVLVIPKTWFIGLLLVGLAIWWILVTKDDYAVRISTNAGEANSHISKNKIYIQNIVNALNDAIIHRG
jgi:hypothetical protein